jgi:hypothetical protein
MNYTIDLSQGRLEERRESSKFIYQAVAILIVLIVLVVFVWSWSQGTLELSFNLFQFLFFSFMLILPATGWFYRLYGNYLKLLDDKLVYKPRGKSKLEYPIDRLDKVSFSNKMLYIRLVDGELVEHHLDGPNLTYKVIQDIKMKIREFSDSLDQEVSDEAA